MHSVCLHFFIDVDELCLWILSLCYDLGRKCLSNSSDVYVSSTKVELQYDYSRGGARIYKFRFCATFQSQLMKTDEKFCCFYFDYEQTPSKKKYVRTSRFTLSIIWALGLPPLFENSSKGLFNTLYTDLKRNVGRTLFHILGCLNCHLVLC